jgi:Ca2+-binding RTX toxin-like protein
LSKAGRTSVPQQDHHRWASVLALTALALVSAPVIGEAEGSRALPVSARTPGEQGCTITGTAGDDEALVGTDGADVICGLGGDDWIRARDGRDVVFGGAGEDNIFGGPGDDRVFGGRGFDEIFGGPGDDGLYGGSTTDSIVANPGNDRVWGGRGRDGIYGRGGADVMRGGPGAEYCIWSEDHTPDDRVIGGGGTDRFEVDPGDVIRSAETSFDCAPTGDG